MLSTASSRVRALKGKIGYKGLARYASTSAVATKSSAGGLLSWLTGDNSSVQDFDFPLEGVVNPPPLPDYVEPGKTRVSILSNGVRIASEASVGPTASVGLYVDSGSIYETPESYGVSHLLERMAFKSTTNRSHLRLIREIEAIGGNVTANASREHMSYTCDGLKTYVPHMVELLVDSVRNPAFLDWEVSEEIKNVNAEIDEYSKDPQNLLMEAIQNTAYFAPYGNALYASKSAVNKLNSTVLEKFVSENYTAPRLVLAASGVDHDRLVEYAEPLLSDLPKVTRPLAPPEALYKGGEIRIQADSNTTHVAVAFGLPGGWVNLKDAMTLTVLQILMGGGGSFSLGGPGKGMYSRLFTRVLNHHPELVTFNAFSNIFNHSGLFGIQASCESDFAVDAMSLAARELCLIAKPLEVTDVQLKRAKQTTKSAILMNLESKAIASEDIGKQILTYGTRHRVENFLTLVDAVTVHDITDIAKKLLSSPLTLGLYGGDVLTLPSYEALSDMCKKKISDNFSRF